MNSNSSRNYTTECYGYSPLYYVIQNKSTPVLEQKVFTEQPTNETLKAFYENSVNLVGQFSQSSAMQNEIGESIKLPPQDSLINESNLLKYQPQKVAKCTMTQTNSNDKINTNNLKKPLSKRMPPYQRENSSNHTSVHLLKVGAKYHSLSQLTDEQTRLVKQAIQNIDLEKGPIKPSYDTATNTKIIYKVVSPNDLTIVGKNKIAIVDSTRNEAVKIKQKIKSKPDTMTTVEDNIVKNFVKVTRSGRAVKIPKHIQCESTHEEVLQRNKIKSKTTIMSCLQCCAEFSNIYKLQRHYELHPSHIPSNTHTSVFHCLLAIVNNSKTEDRSSIFLQQLEQLINKLKSILPCLLKKFDGIEGTFCRISEDVGRLFGMSPGKYNLNMDALNCIKETDGSCKHNPKKTSNSDASKPSHVWLSKHKEETAVVNEVTLCARTNSIEKWPPFNKRVWKYKQSLMDHNSKKVKKNILTETCDIDLGEDNINITKDQNSNTPIQNKEHTVNFVIKDPINDTISPKKSHIKFHSNHFDIRSSPIKNQQSGVFNKFQINMSRLPSKFEGQLLKSSTFVETVNEPPDSDHSLARMLSKTNAQENPIGIIDLDCKTSSRDICFNHEKDWIGTSNVESHQSIQANACIEPNMIHVQHNALTSDERNHIEDILNVNDSCLPLPPEPLNVLERLGNDCLTFHDTELRSNPIELSLDLFPFTNP